MERLRLVPSCSQHRKWMMSKPKLLLLLHCLILNSPFSVLFVTGDPHRSLRNLRHYPRHGPKPVLTAVRMQPCCFRSHVPQVPPRRMRTSVPRHDHFSRDLDVSGDDVIMRFTDRYWTDWQNPRIARGPDEKGKKVDEVRSTDGK